MAKILIRGYPEGYDELLSGYRRGGVDFFDVDGDKGILRSVGIDVEKWGILAEGWRRTWLSTVKWVSMGDLEGRAVAIHVGGFFAV